MTGTSLTGGRGGATGEPLLQDPSNLASTDPEMEPVQLEEDFCGQPLEWSVQAMNPPKDRLEQAGTMLNELGERIEAQHCGASWA